MFIYNSTTQAFIGKVKKMVKEILCQDFSIQFNRQRFLYKKHTYPLNIVVFEKNNILGHFDESCYQIGLNKTLLQVSDEILKDIIKHELVHYITFIEYGHTKFPHGEEFKTICRKYFGKSIIEKATLNIQEAQSNNSDRVLEKVKKLFNLASSSNTHESELATIKANELLLKYNLEYLGEVDETAYVLRVIQAKRNSAKLHSIYEILKTFFVTPVFNYAKNTIYLEVIGTKINVELAQYVANFLDHELENIWLQAKKENSLKGITAKNSFMRGISSGFTDKIYEIQRSNTNKKSLIKIQNNLERSVKLAYGKLSHSAVKASFHTEGNNLGKKYGKGLTIRPGVSQNKDKSKLLSFLK